MNKNVIKNVETNNDTGVKGREDEVLFWHQFLSHTKQFCDSIWVSCNLTKFWHYLEIASIPQVKGSIP